MAAEPNKPPPGRFKVQHEVCAVCTKAVYLTEKLAADGVVFHKSCFKCSQCAKTLSLGNYASLEGVYYCKPHFKQLFALKGNYSEGFGLQKPQEIWASKQDPTDSAPAVRIQSPSTQDHSISPSNIPQADRVAAVKDILAESSTKPDQLQAEFIQPPAREADGSQARPPIGAVEQAGKTGIPSAQPVVEAPRNIQSKRDSTSMPAAETPPCCPKCNTAIVASSPVLAKFCRVCGARLAAAEAQKTANLSTLEAPLLNRPSSPPEAAKKSSEEISRQRNQTEEVAPKAPEPPKEELAQTTNSVSVQSSRKVLVLFVVVVLIAVVLRLFLMR